MTFKELKEGLKDNLDVSGTDLLTDQEKEYFRHGSESYNQAVEDTANATLEWVLGELEKKKVESDTLLKLDKSSWVAKTGVAICDDLITHLKDQLNK